MNTKNKKDAIPNEKAIEDFKNLNRKRLLSMVDATERGQGQTVKMTFDIPIEHVTLAAWLELRLNQYHNKRTLPMHLSDLMEDPLNAHELDCAKTWMSRLIDEQMMFDGYHELSIGIHPYLYKKP